MKLQSLASIVCLMLSAAVHGAAHVMSLSGSSKSLTRTMLPPSPASSLVAGNEIKEDVDHRALHIPDIEPGKFLSMNTKGRERLEYTYREYMKSLQKITTLPRSVLSVVFDYLPSEELPHELKACRYAAPLQEMVTLSQERTRVITVCWIGKKRIISTTPRGLHLWDTSKPDNPIKTIILIVSTRSFDLVVDVVYCPQHEAIVCLLNGGNVVIAKIFDDTFDILAPRDSYSSSCPFNQKVCWSNDGMKLALIGTEEQKGKKHRLEIVNVAWKADGMAQLQGDTQIFFMVKNNDGLVCTDISWSADDRYVFIVERGEGVHRYDVQGKNPGRYCVSEGAYSLPIEVCKRVYLDVFAAARAQSPYRAYAGPGRLFPGNFRIVIENMESKRTKIVVLEPGIRGRNLWWKNGLLVCSLRVPSTIPLEDRHHKELIVFIDPETGSSINEYEFETQTVNLLAFSPDSTCLAYLDNDRFTIRILASSFTTATPVETLMTTPTPAKYLSQDQKRRNVLHQQRKLSARYAYRQRIQHASIIAGVVVGGISAVQKDPCACLASVCVSFGIHQSAHHLARFLASYKK